MRLDRGAPGSTREPPGCLPLTFWELLGRCHSGPRAPGSLAARPGSSQIIKSSIRELPDQKIIDLGAPWSGGLMGCNTCMRSYSYSAQLVPHSEILVLLCAAAAAARHA